MLKTMLKTGLALLLAGFVSLGQAHAQRADPLPSWNDGPTKQAIVDFVAAVTRDGSPDFVPPSERLAVFDNDGTLWPEQPMYVQLAFALDRVKALAPLNPGWTDRQPFKAALEGDLKTLAGGGTHAIAELVMATHAGMTSTEFAAIATGWLASARHPRFGRAYTDLAYQPMLEVLAHLRANGFTTAIVSGGGVEFMRPWTERVYGVPKDRVIGSTIRTRFEMRDGRPELFRLPEAEFIDDGPGKPVGINRQMGMRPIAAFGNSDGDLEMLQWTTFSGGRRLGVIVHHTDGEREFEYDRASAFGHLEKALDAATVNNWTVVDMKRDWKTIFAPPKP